MAFNLEFSFCEKNDKKIEVTQSFLGFLVNDGPSSAIFFKK